MEKLLVISYYWPPASGPGVQRILKFVKYLSEMGWEVYVVTPEDGGFPYLDEELESEIPSSIKVIKTKTSDPFKAYNLLKGKKGKSIPVSVVNDTKNSSLVDRLSKWVRANLFIPDARVGWNKFAYKVAKELIEQHGIQKVITTSPPHSTQLIGLKLKKNLGVKWLADMRDPWINIYINKFLPRSAKTISKDQRLEDSVIENADQLVVVSKGLEKEFSDRSNSISVIPNGYDTTDVKELNDSFDSEVFKLGYIGNYKGNQDVVSLWEAIGELIEENLQFKKLFRLDLTGRVAKDVESSIRQFVPNENIELRGFVNHSEAVEIMSLTNLLLFIIPISPTNKGIITGKIFEYLATRNPILSIGPVDGDAAEIINEVGRKAMIDYSNKESIKAQLLNEFEEWIIEGKTNRTKNLAFQSYSREKLAGRLHQLLKSL